MSVKSKHGIVSVQRIQATHLWKMFTEYCQRNPHVQEEYFWHGTQQPASTLYQGTGFDKKYACVGTHAFFYSQPF
jgi:hypothetical protein